MASRDFLKHIVSTDEPAISTLGDEWFNPTTNRLYKRVATNGTSVAWREIPSNIDSISTATISSKQIVLRINSTASITSPMVWTSDSFDQYVATAQANAIAIIADAGTPVDGQKMIFRFKDNGTAQGLTWTTGSAKAFRAIGVILPITTVVGKILYVGCIYNATDVRWDVVAVSQEA
jgi:hypothetical protein